MEVKEAIERRRSIRAYKDEEVPRSLLEDIMESVRMAPSASNRQDWKFIIIDDESTKDQIYEAANEQSFVREAPVVIAGVATEPDEMMSCEVSAGTVDLSIALDHLTLRAAEEGLGTCWIGAFDQEKAKEILEIPEDHKVISLMPLGYPTYDLTREEKRRKKLEEIISYNKF
ncbi:MAG: nitroreductase family protein [Candidatus Bipolaricaulota bacterium]|nr:nitroreductase family protein [Candidatus Bipolaricaulota bacterium]MBS3793068.1 nitroreductase family protein [Candidatus Bipolaricaulota bacterium]